MHAPPQQAGSTGPGEVVIAADGTGQYTSLKEAVPRVAAGTRIRVRPGIYREGIVIDKSLEIIGDGAREETVIEASGSDCIRMEAERAVVKGLTLCCRAGEAGLEFFGVDAKKGHLVIEECDITSDSLACVAVHGANTVATVRNCRIHDGKRSGVWVYWRGRGTFEGCDIFANARAGVGAGKGGTPEIRNCRINRNGSAAVWVQPGGEVTVEGCDLSNNKRGAWKISGGMLSFLYGRKIVSRNNRE